MKPAGINPFPEPACLRVDVTYISGSEPGTVSKNSRIRFGGADRDRTGDLMLAKHALSQLSYSPTFQNGGPG